ncbi:MAG: hypothetical protein IM618_11230 [Cytophagales bacterium]|jgi:hypothetical protein|nr:hypothetical protein [Cytophagales bacterium]
MTLQEAKNTIAKRYGYPDWKSIDWYQVDYTLSESQTKGHAQDILGNEASELYAKTNWEEACLEQRKQWIKKMPITQLVRGDISTTQFVEQLEGQPLPLFQSGSHAEDEILGDEGIDSSENGAKIINMHEHEKQRIFKKILKRGEPNS